MLFSSISFLYYFLPVVFFLYLITPRRWKNGTLLLASLFFYAWGEPRYVFLMLAEILATYLLVLLMHRYRSSPAGKYFFISALVLSLALLGIFKYADFFIENWNHLTGASLPLPKLALPIGISFYTFQLLSYVIDVYREQVPPQRNFFHLAAYVALFPQLIAGPILRYADLADQLTDRTHTIPKTLWGIRRFLIGLSKKILLANALGALCAICQDTQTPSVLFAWIHAIAFTLQIYFDFSGYSDMAIGLGSIFGFSFAENFRYPYISGSITEFWRRWHISLGSWFRDYVYIPLGGNRVSRPRHLFNIALVWFLTGFWHGAAWNFIFWGIYFCLLLVMEKQWLLPYLNRSAVWKHVYVLLAVILGFVLFESPDLPSALSRIGSLFGAGNLPFLAPDSLYYLRSYGITLILGILGSTPLPARITERLRQHPYGQTVLSVAEPLFLAFLLLSCTGYLADGSFNPFLYFRF